MIRTRFIAPPLVAVGDVEVGGVDVIEDNEVELPTRMGVVPVGVATLEDDVVVTVDPVEVVVAVVPPPPPPVSGVCTQVDTAITLS
jgi:hypothetical protein